MCVLHALCAVYTRAVSCAYGLLNKWRHTHSTHRTQSMHPILSITRTRTRTNIIHKHIIHTYIQTRIHMHTHTRTHTHVHTQARTLYQPIPPPRALPRPRLHWLRCISEGMEKPPKMGPHTAGKWPLRKSSKNWPNTRRQVAMHACRQAGRKPWILCRAKHEHR